MTKLKEKQRKRAGSDAKHDRAGLKADKIYTKKGGAGGNFTWGLPGDESFIPAINEGDPNYDSDDMFDKDQYWKLSFTENELKSTQQFSYLRLEGETDYAPKMSLREFKLKVEKDIRELLNTEDYGEFIQRVSLHECKMLHFALVKKMLELSMEMTDREREVVSLALIELQNNHQLPFTQVAKGFERLFERIEDLSLDIPSAPKMLAQFLARCVADDVLPPAFLMDKYIESLAGPIIQRARVLLSMKHGLGRLERVWGAGIKASVDSLKTEIKNILIEYLNSSDCGEVSKLLQKLNVPFFHHEVVKRAVMISFERKEREQAMISVLLKQLVSTQVISSKQVLLGYQRLYSEINDIVLDNPDAAALLDIFANQSVRDECFSEDDLHRIKENARIEAEKRSKMLAEEYSRARADSVPS